MRMAKFGRPTTEAKPFGGKLQLIVCGDFMQLPPVQKDKNKASTSNKKKVIRKRA